MDKSYCNRLVSQTILKIYEPDSTATAGDSKVARQVTLSIRRDERVESLIRIDDHSLIVGTAKRWFSEPNKTIYYRIALQ